MVSFTCYRKATYIEKTFRNYTTGIELALSKIKLIYIIHNDFLCLTENSFFFYLETPVGGYYLRKCM